tara:strand:- start:2592 stop:2873 length:282 start_codon:yes stop_codon:yes gene_type:complete
MQVLWNDVVIAESSNTAKYNGSYYFPASSLRNDFFRKSPDTHICPLRGTGNYFDLFIEGNILPNAACHYPSPLKEDVKYIAGMIEFSSQLEIQ